MMKCFQDVVTQTVNGYDLIVHGMSSPGVKSGFQENVLWTIFESSTSRQLTAIGSNLGYVRSLRSNNTPSTTKADWKDWPRIVEVCFDNREADIGRFMRRHLSGITPKVLRELVSATTKGIEEAPTENLLRRYLQESEERYNQVIQERRVKLPDHGVWEVALLLVGDVPPYSANRQFLNLLDSSNPDYTGWPVWLDSRGFTDESARPYVVSGVWEAFIASLDSGRSDHVDFMRLDPKGRFYLRRALQDDISGSSCAPKLNRPAFPETQLFESGRHG